MASYRKVRTLLPVVAAYIAGLIDGEGTVTLSMLHGGERRRIVVSISNTDRELLEFVRESVGAGLITGKRCYSERHSPSYAYKIAGRQALDLLVQVEGFLKTYRSGRAKLAIERYVAVTPRNGKYGPAILLSRLQFERAFLALGPGPRGRPRR